MERLKNMELKKTFLVLSASCVLVALLMLGLVFMICNSISSNFPSGGIEILADGSIVKMETPTETQQNILSMLGIIQIVSCIVLPMGGLALSGILYYHIKLKQPISTLRNGISRIRNHDLDFSMPVHSDDELGQLCTAFDTMREELLKSNQELWRQAEERKRLNAAFSHDLRNPITVLKGTIKLLRQGTADEQAIDRLESYALAEDLNVDERYIQYNWVLLDAIGISYDEAADSDTGTGFSFMTAACILVGVLVLLAAGLVIYNILKISITKRIKEYGTLRAIGGERGQIYRLVSLQLLILCGAGIPIGLLLGILSAKGVLIAATGLLNPDLFMANSTSELNSAINTASTVKLPMLFASIAVILLFALLAAFPAARYASHVSPTVAMSGQTVKIKRRIKRNRNIRNFEAYYARLNLKRGRGRTAVTILSLVMSITVFVALQSFTGLLDASSSVQDMYFSDYAVTNETVGIPSEAVKTLAENDAVESVSTTRLSVFMPGAGDILPFETDLSVQSHETLQLVNVDEAQLQIYAPNLSAQDKQALKDGTGCLVKNPIAFSYGDTTVQQTDLTVGDTIQLGDRTLPVLGLIDTAITINNDGFTNGVQLIVNDEIYCSLLGNDSYSEVYPTLQDNADTDTFESWLDSWCSNYPGTHWLSYLQSSNEMIESFEQIKMLCWVLIIFIGIIGILNIINTVYSNIHTRVGEIGMQRAIGMSAASLYKTFLWEGAYYGIIASVIGAVFGYVCCIFVGAAQTDALQLVAVPVMAIVEAAIISIVACLLATAIPLRSIARMSIVDSIETVE